MSNFKRASVCKCPTGFVFGCWDQDRENPNKLLFSMFDTEHQFNWHFDFFYDIEWSWSVCTGHVGIRKWNPSLSFLLWDKTIFIQINSLIQSVFSVLVMVSFEVSSMSYLVVCLVIILSVCFVFTSCSGDGVQTWSSPWCYTVKRNHARFTLLKSQIVNKLQTGKRF